MKKILLTSTSFQDTPGEHQLQLESTGYEITRLRGPLVENELLPIIDQFDGIICGDDDITQAVIKKGATHKLKVISKYGSGLDKIDLKAAKELGVPVTSCPAVNQTTVAEHVFALLLTHVKNIIQENKFIQEGKWKRLIGNDLAEKTLGVMGTGNVGKEVVKRALAFGMKIIAYDQYPDTAFSAQYGIRYAKNAKEVYQESDIITLHMNLDQNSRHMLNKEAFKFMKDGVILINTARAGLVVEEEILNAVNAGKLGGYLTDVLEVEPMPQDHSYLNHPKILITPHIGSRTYENVVKQGTMAVNNLIENLNVER